LDESVFKANDIRGTVPEQINEEFAFLVGRGLVRGLNAQRIAVGWDGRISSPGLASALSAGVLAEGGVLDSLGLSPSELLYYVMGAMPGYDLGVMVTASHNPGRFNGFKIIAPGALPLTERTGLDALRGWMRSHWGAGGRTGAVAQAPAGTLDVEGEYMAHCVRAAGGLPRAAGLKVVVDPGNGTGGLLWQRLSALTRVEPLRMNFEPDGRFPAHAPDPSKPDNLKGLLERVAAEHADLGLAYDGDADRTVVVLSGGHIMDGSEMIAALAERAPAGGRSGRFGVSMTTSRGVLDHFRARGCEPVMVPVGHAKVKRIMQADAEMAFAGEQSGHYFYREFFCAESSVITTLHVLHLASAGRLARLVAELPGPWHAPPAEASFHFDRQDRALQVCRAVARAGLEMFPGPREIMCEINWAIARACRPEDLDRCEGVRVDYDDWWFCVRPSATEPLARLRVEALDPDLRRSRQEALAALFGRGAGE
jgi:phosphomannomutase